MFSIKFKKHNKFWLCRYCTYYQDELKDILNLKDKNDKPQIAGVGICFVTKRVVKSTDGYKCNDFDKDENSIDNEIII